MSWIIYSSLMFTASVFLYLFIRKAQKQKIHIAVYSISMFLLPAITNFISAIYYDFPLLYDFKLFAFVIFTAFLWSYLGNFFSQRAILVAPNPGYSLIVSKSYVILTTIAAVFLFGSELSIKKIAGIVIIIVFSALVSISKDKKKTGLRWVWLSIGAHLCWAYGSLASKYLLNQGLSPFQYLPYISLTVTMLNMLEVRHQKVKLQFEQSQWITIIMIGVFNWLFNLFMQFGYRESPNPGYVSAFNVSSIMAVALLSTVMFKDSLSFKKVLGILGIIGGLVIMLV